MSPPVLFDVTERVATITLNRPEARNALTREVLALLTASINRAEQDAEVDVLILTGSDPAFCAGLDLDAAGQRRSCSAPPRRGPTRDAPRPVREASPSR